MDISFSQCLKVHEDMKIYNNREFPGILRYRDQFFPIPVPILFSGTNFFRYRDRYFFPGPNFSGTGTGTFFRDQIFPVPVPVPSKKEQNSRDREFPGPGCHTLASACMCKVCIFLQSDNKWFNCTIAKTIHLHFQFRVPSRLHFSKLSLCGSIDCIQAPKISQDFWVSLFLINIFCEFFIDSDGGGNGKCTDNL